MAVTVGLYNLMNAFVDVRQPPGRKWAERVDKVVANLCLPREGNLPHILGFVEMNVVMLEDLKDRLPGHAFLGAATQNEKPFQQLTKEDFIGELLVIGYDKGVVRAVLEEETRWFSPTPLVPMSKFDDTCRYPRAIHYARLELQDQIVSVFCSHYDDFNVQARARAVSLEAEFIEEKRRLHPEDLILALGDRNFYPDKGIGPVHASKLQKASGLKAPDYDTEGGPIDTWIGWETDPYCNKVDEHGQWGPKRDRVYDQILSSKPPRRYGCYPGQFDDKGHVLGPKDTDWTQSPRMFASDHCLVFAEYQ